MLLPLCWLALCHVKSRIITGRKDAGEGGTVGGWLSAEGLWALPVELPTGLWTVVWRTVVVSIAHTSPLSAGPVPSSHTAH